MTDRVAGADDEATAAERAHALRRRAKAAARDGRIDDAEALYREALAAAEGGADAAACEQASRVLTAHARMLARHGRAEEALELYEASIARAETAGDEPWARGRMLYALYGHGRALRRLDRGDEALLVFSRLRDVLGDGPADEDVLPVVVRGLLLRAAYLRDREDYDAAVEAYGEVVERFGDTEVAREKVAGAHLAYVLTLQERALSDAGDVEGSAALCRAAIPRVLPFDEDEEAARLVASLFYDLATRLSALGDPEAAVATWAELVERYGDRDDERLRMTTGRALEASGSVLWHSGRLDEALALADEVERRYGEDDDAELRGYVARAARRRIAIQLVRGEVDAVVDGARTLLGRCGDAPEDAVREPAREVRLDLGSALMRRGEHAEAVVVLEAYLADPGDADHDTFVLRARMARALAFHQGGRPDEAAAEYEALLADLEDRDEPWLRDIRMTALLNAADAQLRAGDEEAMFAAHRRFLEAVADDVAGAFAVLRREAARRDPADPMMRNQGAMLDLKEAATLGELERVDEARDALAGLIARWEDDPLPDVAGAVAMAREMLGELGED